ncbi:hypothetical protein [Streptomyces sp. NPDC029041]|uniref:hypothetical protein n=1 Tax=Streptomyces sp. NPDC029041 TaxID=3155727 RepID=UPI003400BDC0
MVGSALLGPADEGHAADFVDGVLGLVQCGFEGGQDGVVAAVLGEPLVERAGRAVQRHLLVEGLGHELHGKYLGGDVRVFAQSLLVPVAGGTDPAEGAL